MMQNIGKTKLRVKAIKNGFFGIPKVILEWNGEEYELREGDYLELNLDLTSIRIDFS